ncbi:uncharacterized protein V1516DRAFT_667837 [Lipomyces oligophaga]|uniref:uncharacterized protein n=1 Tax=Lipomyces oligophaga TaxID=45792 RepID=UPI0034CD71FC
MESFLSDSGDPHVSPFLVAASGSGGSNTGSPAIIQPSFISSRSVSPITQTINEEMSGSTSVTTTSFDPDQMGQSGAAGDALENYLANPSWEPSQDSWAIGNGNPGSSFLDTSEMINLDGSRPVPDMSDMLAVSMSNDMHATGFTSFENSLFPSVNDEFSDANSSLPSFEISNASQIQLDRTSLMNSMLDSQSNLNGHEVTYNDENSSLLSDLLAGDGLSIMSNARASSDHLQNPQYNRMRSSSMHSDYTSTSASPYFGSPAFPASPYLGSGASPLPALENDMINISISDPAVAFSPEFLPSQSAFENSDFTQSRPMAHVAPLEVPMINISSFDSSNLAGTEIHHTPDPDPDPSSLSPPLQNRRRSNSDPIGHNQSIDSSLSVASAVNSRGRRNSNAGPIRRPRPSSLSPGQTYQSPYSDSGVSDFDDDDLDDGISVNSGSGRPSRSGSVSSNSSQRRAVVGNGNASRDYILDLAAPTRGERQPKNPANYACTLCSKRFTRGYNLRSHLRTHTDERPFKCSFCNKAFARQHDRKRHESLHSGVRKFECHGTLSDGVTVWGCGRKFARADALGRHFRSEAGRECIRPLVEEEKQEKAEMAAKQEARKLSGIITDSSQFTLPDDNWLPTALMKRYPTLSTLDLPPDNVSVSSSDFEDNEND